MRKAEMTGKIRWTAVLAGAGMLLCAAPALAMHVEITGEPCQLIVRTSLPQEGEDASSEAQEGLGFLTQMLENGQEGIFGDGETAGESAGESGGQEMLSQGFELREVTGFELYGFVSSEYIAINPGDGDVYVSRDELADKLPEIPVDRLPEGQNLETISAGSTGENVIALQQNLIRLGYLEGEADGQYGGGTAGAISRFQEDHHLETTGNAGIYTQMAIQMALDGMEETLLVSYPVYKTVEEKFADLLPHTSEDLSAYLDPAWHLSYDVFEKFGTINPAIVLGTYEATDVADIDRITITASLQVIISQNEETGELQLQPCLVTDSLGAFRPYLQGAYLQGGTWLVELEGGKSTGGLEGGNLKEKGYIPLTEEALVMLSDESVQSFSIRVKGKNQSFDIEVTGDRDRIAWFGKEC